MFDDEFYLSHVLFGCHAGHNDSKLSKLYKESLTKCNWQSAVTKFTKHQKHSDIHRDSMFSMVEFKNVMTVNTKCIDWQRD